MNKNFPKPPNYQSDKHPWNSSCCVCKYGVNSVPNTYCTKYPTAQGSRRVAYFKTCNSWEERGK